MSDIFIHPCIFTDVTNSYISLQLGGPAVPVEINMSIRSMGPVDENKMVFALDCYFRQSWIDERLKFLSLIHI